MLQSLYKKVKWNYILNVASFWRSVYPTFRDNPDVDIYGCNLYQRYLLKRRARARRVKVKASIDDRLHLMSADDDILDDLETESDSDSDEYIGLESANSVLVCTGVYDGSRDYTVNNQGILDHNHRDFIMDPELRRPTMVATNVLEAVQAIFRREGLS